MNKGIIQLRYLVHFTFHSKLIYGILYEILKKYEAPGHAYFFTMFYEQSGSPTENLKVFLTFGVIEDFTFLKASSKCFLPTLISPVKTVVQETLTIIEENDNFDKIKCVLINKILTMEGETRSSLLIRQFATELFFSLYLFFMHFHAYLLEL